MSSVSSAGGRSPTVDPPLVSPPFLSPPLSVPSPRPPHPPPFPWPFSAPQRSSTPSPLPAASATTPLTPLLCYRSPAVVAVVPSHRRCHHAPQTPSPLNKCRLSSPASTSRSAMAAVPPQRRPPSHHGGQHSPAAVTRLAGQQANRHIRNPAARHPLRPVSIVPPCATVLSCDRACTPVCQRGDVSQSGNKRREAVP